MTDRDSGLRSANLNLIPVLRALLREASVTRAGRSLGLTPSAVSCALADLRVMMGDPLLVRIGQGMRLTPRAEQLASKLEHACLVLEDLLQEPAFDPGTAQRTFVVASVDYVGLLIGPPLAARLRDIAPDVRIRFVDLPSDLELRLARGEVDLALLAVNHLEWSGVSAAPPWRDVQVGVVDAAHPLAGRTSVTEAELSLYPEVSWAPGLDLSIRAAASGTSLAGTGAMRSRLLTQSVCAIPLMVRGTDMVARTPSALARHLAQSFPLHVFDLPDSSLVLETGGLWSKVQDADPAHRWFRGEVLDVLAAVHR